MWMSQKHVVCRCEASWMRNSLKSTLVYGWEMNNQFSGNSSGGHSRQSACQFHVPSKLDTPVALCCVTNLHLLEWPFIVPPSTRCTCVMITLFNQLLVMPHLSGGWIILEKEKCSLTRM
jgi:hypothetical protein